MRLNELTISFQRMTLIMSDIATLDSQADAELDQAIESLQNNAYHRNQNVNIQEVKIFPNYVQVNLNGQTKSISILDFKMILDSMLQVDTKLDAMALPFGTFIFAKSAGTIQLSCYYPEQKKKIKYQSSRYGEPVNITEFEIPFPNMVISHNLNKKDGFWMVSDTRYMVTTKTPNQLPNDFVQMNKNPSLGLFLPPFTNVYNECRLCYGQNTMPSKFHNNLRGLDYYYQVLFESPFNNDLGIKGVKPEFRKSDVGAFYKALSEQETFPYHWLNNSTDY